MTQLINLSVTDKQFQSLKMLIIDIPTISNAQEVLIHCMESYSITRSYVEYLQEQIEFLQLMVEDSRSATEFLLNEGRL